jgi:hypothetical protein
MKPYEIPIDCLVPMRADILASTKPKASIAENNTNSIIIENNLLRNGLAILSGVKISHISKFIKNKSLCISLPIGLKIETASYKSKSVIFIDKKHCI